MQTKVRKRKEIAEQWWEKVFGVGERLRNEGKHRLVEA
jgi:hypothetical protein